MPDEHLGIGFKTFNMNVPLTEDLFRQVERVSRLENRTKAAFVRDAVRHYIDMIIEGKTKVRAQQLHQENGYRQGNHLEDWFQAKKEIVALYGPSPLLQPPVINAKAASQR
jgi:Protein of unknown function (DUF2934)